MQKQKNGHTGLLPNVTVIPFFPLEDVWIMVFELSLIRFAFTGRFLAYKKSLPKPTGIICFFIVLLILRRSQALPLKA